jgi:prolyl-tRNA synthetase
MIKLSTFPIKTLKSRPNVSDNKSTGILMQAWFIRQTMAWVYNYTTLWLKVLRNIEKIVREEMDNYWASELYMSSLSPRELWDKTGRWDAIDVMFHLPTWEEGKEYWLNSTHEEVVVPLMNEFINSYKDSNTCVYQIQTKFRNEKRAKSGLLRWREFIMKDAYSFHVNNKDFIEYYEWMKQVYMNVFNRLGIWKDTYITLADWWTFTDKYSHEFQTLLPIWEDTIYIDEKAWISYNQEVAPSKIAMENISDKNMLEKQDIKHAWDIIWVDALEKLLWIPKTKTTKTMFFETDGKRFIVTCVRGDYEINTIKLRKILWCKKLELATEERVKKVIWTKIGYAWIINLPAWIELFIDDSVKWLTNFETWTNKDFHHSINVNFWRDLELPEEFYDFKDAKEWDLNPETWNKFVVKKASEVWNIFPLETKFSKPFGMKMLDWDNKEKDVIMWCYGIWISRAMWVVAEYFAWEKWINWPENIAPADYYIIVLWEENINIALKIVQDLEKKWNSVIFDDRMWKKVWFWQKAWDSELYWIPNRIVISPKTIESGGYELLKRWETEWKIIKF